MKSVNEMEEHVLRMISDIDVKAELPSGAFNLRLNGVGVYRNSTENVTIEPKKDLPGIDIIVKPGTKGETVYIPVVVSHSGLTDKVYNFFEIGENSDVTIVAGCGIHNDGCTTSQHDGIHTFHVGKGATLKYIEKHYGEGDGEGSRILNPTTVINMEEGSVCVMETTQIRGVDSTLRKTTAHLAANAKLTIVEKLMTHGNQRAESDMDAYLDGNDSVLQITSRSVARDTSVQRFHPNAIGNARCRAHIQCDAIIMDSSRVGSIPEITANHVDAQIIHEAAIGRINNDQLIKLETFGMTEQEAEEVIVKGFLK